MDNNKKQVALVIGSGSVKCAAAIGLYKVLQREGIEIDEAARAALEKLAGAAP